MRHFLTTVLENSLSVFGNAAFSQSRLQNATNFDVFFASFFGNRFRQSRFSSTFSLSVFGNAEFSRLASTFLPPNRYPPSFRFAFHTLRWLFLEKADKMLVGSSFLAQGRRAATGHRLRPSFFSKPDRSKKLTVFENLSFSRFCASSAGREEKEEQLVVVSKLSSYLCIPPSQSQQHVAILLPYFGHLDLSPAGVRRTLVNLQRRRMQTVDLEALAADWDRRVRWRAEIERLESERTGVIEEIRRQMERGLTTADVADRIAVSRQLLAEGKAVTKVMRALEETLMPRLLALPNELHPATPRMGSEDQIQDGRVAEGLSLEIQDVRAAKGRSSEDFMDGRVAEGPSSMAVPGPYYEGRLALAELATLDLFGDVFAAAGFEPICGPDLCRPVVVEGCGLDFADPGLTFQLRPDDGENDFRLVGSASLPPFCAYLTKCSVPDSLLPLRLSAAGRCYGPPAAGRPQSSQLHFFFASGSRAEEDEAFESCFRTLTVAYEALGLSCRRVDAAAYELTLAESRRAWLQVWLPDSPKRWPVANVASCGEFISRRLWMCRHGGDGRSGFLRAVHGTAVSFPELLDCLTDGQRTADGEVWLPDALLDRMNDYRR